MEKGTHLAVNDSIKRVQILYKNPVHISPKEIYAAVENLDSVIIINQYTERSLILEYDVFQVEFQDIYHSLLEKGLDIAAVEKQFDLKNFNCISCKTHLESALQETPGVISVNSNLSDSTLTVKFAEDSISKELIKEQLGDLGYI